MTCRAALPITLFCATVCLALPVHAYNGDPELLQLLLNARRENMDGILTWRGTATRTKSTIYKSGQSARRSSQEVNFAYDQSLDAVRWNLIEDQRMGRYGALLIDEMFIRHDPGEVDADGHMKNTLVISPRGGPMNSRRLPTDFDPMWYFTCRGIDTDEFLSFHYSHRDDSAFNEGGKSIAREGDLITWETGGSQLTNHWVFDLSKGGNLVQYIGKDSRVETQYDWSYEQIGGVWVPAAFESTNRQKDSKGRGMHFSTKVVFTANEVNVDLADDEFTHERLGVKPGTRVSNHVTGFAYRFGEEQDGKVINYNVSARARTQADALIGETAPDFTVERLDGSSFTLSEQRGEILILDFWATWCGPCRVATPVLRDVASEFADDGVHLYTVNLREEPERIREFLEDEGLQDVKVLLDTDGAIGDMYLASSIPEIVIVGRDGTVVNVYVGLWASPPPPKTVGLTPDELSILTAATLADVLRKELGEIVGTEAAAEISFSP